MSPPPAPRRFGVAVPMKPPAVAKSRLAPLGDALRRDLVVAFAADTVEAALHSPRVDLVLAVTDDHELARELAALGARVIPDATSDDLNASLSNAAAEIARLRPDLGVAALCADLPALRPAELTSALTEAGNGRPTFVADAARAGTTLLAAPARARFDPRFGHDSRRAHLAAGATEVDRARLPGLRRDVDTHADLADAIRLGVGAHTARVVARHRL